MGGSESVEWLGVLDASFEASLARDEETAAADLAFSLRQDADLRAALSRSGTGWALLIDGEGSRPIDEVGVDYVRAGDELVPLRGSVVRSTPGAPPRRSDRTLLEVLGELCRGGRPVDVRTARGRVAGTLLRAGRDHLAVAIRDQEALVALGAVEAVGTGYSASRGFSG